MKILYHTDNDGIVSAIQVAKFRGIETTYIPVNYGMTFDFSQVETNEEVWIVDFSLPVEDMRKLTAITRNVVWIDHHLTSEGMYDDEDIDINVSIHSTRVACCELVYFVVSSIGNITFVDGKMDIEMDTDKLKEFLDYPEMSIMRIPRWIAYIGDWDIWRFTFDDDTKNFITGLRLQDTSPTSELWNKLEDESFIKNIMENGTTIRTLNKQYGKTLLRSNAAYRCIIDNHNAIAINVPSMIANSEWFDIDVEDVDILVMWHMAVIDGKPRYIYSLRRTGDDVDVDVSEIAKQYGGGGHRGAAGFSADTFVL